MSNIKVKNVPRLRLGDLLRRRKMTLKTFMSEFGITTYEALSIRCKRLGVQPPKESEFEALNPALPIVSSPTEGVVVLSATPDSVEQKPLRNGLVHLDNEGEDVKREPLDGIQKTKKKKKDVNPINE